MFEAAKQALTSLRIALSYPAYEASARRAHTAKAESRFSVDEIARIREDLLHSIEGELFARFDAPLSKLESRHRDLSAAISDVQSKLQYFERDYKFELAEAYASLGLIRESRTECGEALATAHEGLASAKASLSRWYAKAESNWLGNAGRQLPKKSFFGQDLADRDRYKNERDAAARRVTELHNRRTAIDAELVSTREKIASIKEARQVMFNLKKEGFERGFLQGVKSRATNDLQTLDGEIQKNRSCRAEYEVQERVRRGVPELEARVEKILANKKAFLSEFDTAEAKVLRKASHRRDWLAKRPQ